MQDHYQIGTCQWICHAEGRLWEETEQQDPQ